MQIRQVLTQTAGASSRNNAALATLLTQAITTVGGDLDCHFSMGGTLASSLAGTVLVTGTFVMLLDGVAQGGFVEQEVLTVALGNDRFSGSIRLRLTGVAAGAHTVAVQWATDSANTTASITPTGEHATLWVTELIP